MQLFRKEARIKARRRVKYTITSGRSKMNIPKILTPKAMTAYLNDNDTVRQGLEVMKRYGYTAIPVLNDHGEYIGCITEGDFLWHILSTGSTSMPLASISFTICNVEWDASSLAVAILPFSSISAILRLTASRPCMTV